MEFSKAGAAAPASVVCRAVAFVKQWEDTIMPTFIVAMNWTEQGIRNVKDAPKRAAAARDMAKKLGVDIKQTYLTNGEFDLISIVETASGDNIAKFCMQVGALGNVRTRTMRAWPESEYHKLISELS
jgi:uncharacterized protein with GYD domain